MKETIKYLNKRIGTIEDSLRSLRASNAMREKWMQEQEEELTILRAELALAESLPQ